MALAGFRGAVGDAGGSSLRGRCAGPVALIGRMVWSGKVHTAFVLLEYQVHFPGGLDVFHISYQVMIKTMPLVPVTHVCGRGRSQATTVGQAT